MRPVALVTLMAGPQPEVACGAGTNASRARPGLLCRGRREVEEEAEREERESGTRVVGPDPTCRRERTHQLDKWKRPRRIYVFPTRRRIMPKYAISRSAQGPGCE